MTDPVDPKAPAAPAPASDAKPGKPKSGNKLKAIVTGMSPREKAVLKVAGLVIAFLFLDLIVVRPVNNYLTRLNELIRVEEKVIPKRLLILKYKDKILKDYRGWKSFMTDPAISQEEEIAMLLREIERVSKDVRLFVSNINPVKVTEKTDSVHELSVDIEGKGGIEEIRKFLLTIEKENPAVRVDAFTFKPASKESEELKYSFTIIKIGVKEKALVNITA